MNIFNKIKKANLVGRGGACFSTATKWEMVKNAKAEKKYVICNGAEGEPGIKKDGYIIKNHPERVIEGIRLAIVYLQAPKTEVEAYLYLNSDYYKKYKRKLEKLIGNNKNIHLFKKDKTTGYIAGEESSAINYIEGKRIEPRLRPPFPTTHGLWGCPTLVNNVETFYNVSLVEHKEYQQERFITINNKFRHKGVYKFAENETIENILKQTKSYPKYDFFVLIGGDVSGTILNKDQLKQPVSGAGSITIFNKKKTKPIELLKYWADFYANQSCGQCTPCREGTYRIKEIVNSKEPDWDRFVYLLDNLDESSFCGLGCAMSSPIRSYFNNVLLKNKESKIKLKEIDSKKICECMR